jgi:hypothetical protein
MSTPQIWSADLLGFLGAYREAFESLDGAAVARLYAEPSGIVSDRGYTHWASRTAVEANMRTLCELYRTDGVRAVDGVPGACLRLGERAAFVTVNWSLQRDSGSRSFATAYNLCREDEQWRVRLCTAYEEQPLNRGANPHD